jgi:hypothetical protein
MKVITAANDEREPADSPQIPWPDVQPRDSRVPKPTRNPPATSRHGWTLVTKAPSANVEREHERAEHQPDAEHAAPVALGEPTRRPERVDPGTYANTVVNTPLAPARIPVSRKISAVPRPITAPPAR